MNPEKHPLQFKTPDLQKSEDMQESIRFSSEDKTKIEQVTTGILSVPEEIREHASDDIIKTLENGHHLNNVWRDEQGQIIGYLAFEDFKPHEAYAKYFGTEGNTRDNPFAFVPKLINKAKTEGYTKIHFHGWNTRLNKVLEHFGFVKTHTDRQGSLYADHFEIRLDEEKDEKPEQKTKEAFEQKYHNHVIKESEKTIETLDEEKQKTLYSVYSDLVQRPETQDLTHIQKTILKLKLARYLQRHDTVDVNTLCDAIIETPKFLDKDKGGFDRLLEIHEQKTVMKVAEMRKKKAEQTGEEELNPYEALFQTESGEYYMARLLNMPHLEEESQYMNHCVGLSDSYISKMKNGDVEILSFRKTPKINHQTQKLEIDEPLLTIEYNIRTKEIQQIKKHSDEYIQESDPYFQDFIESLQKLKDTKLDTGAERDFKKIADSELENINVKDYHVFTEKGEVYFKDIDTRSDTFILKIGKMPITKETSKEDVSLIMKIVEGIEVEPEQIATSKEEVNEHTKAYIGPLYSNIFKELPNTIEHVYTSFPEGKVYIKEIEIPQEEKTSAQYEEELRSQGIHVPQWAEDVLKGADLTQGLGQKIRLIIPTIASLGFLNGATRQEIQDRAKEFGIGQELLPALAGIELRKQYTNQPMNEYVLIDMEAIPGRNGHPGVFHVSRNSAGVWLGGHFGGPVGHWHGRRRCAFLAS